MADSAKDSTELIYLRFWIKSNRGPNVSAHRLIPLAGEGKEREAEIKDWLEDWCSQFGAWTHGDNIVNYGYEILGINVRMKIVECQV